jgi:hypothetical protein
VHVVPGHDHVEFPRLEYNRSNGGISLGQLQPPVLSPAQLKQKSKLRGNTAWISFCTRDPFFVLEANPN